MTWSAVPLILMLAMVLYAILLVWIANKIESDLWSTLFLVLFAVTPIGVLAGFNY